MDYPGQRLRAERRHRHVLLLRLLLRHHHGSRLLDIPCRARARRLHLTLSLETDTLPQFPLKVRGKAVSLSTATNWLFNFALAYAVPPGFKNIAYKTYFIFGTFNAAAFIHILFMFPETAGRTLEEVEAIFAEGHVFTAWRIKRDVGTADLSQIGRRVPACWDDVQAPPDSRDPETLKYTAHCSLSAPANASCNLHVGH